MSDALSQVFDVAPLPRTTVPAEYHPPLPLAEDGDFARENLKNLMVTAKEALENALNVAIQSESPRAYEVVSALINTSADLNNRLMMTHSIQTRIESYAKPEVNNTQNNSTTNNVIFSGTPGELAKLLKGNS
jgi:hypothetical protein